MLSPLQQYQQDLKQPGFKADEAQAHAVQHLQTIYVELMARENQRRHRVLRFFRYKKPVKGLYMWGGVGRGKTYLMDTFFKALPIQRKLRLHFNRFMQMAQQRLAELQGQKDPLDCLARELAAKAVVLCFDECAVTDVADALILGGLFEALFGLGVTLVTTSNIAPDGLYEGGLQRELFLPAIKQIQQHTTVLNVDEGIDYRDLSPSQTQHLYYTPLTQQQAFMSAQFSLRQGALPLLDSHFTLENREVECIQRCKNVIWFEFDQICCDPRSQNDYIALADQYQCVMVSNIPQLHASMDDYAKRLILLVDELYDNEVGLVVSATVPIEQLYCGQRLAFEFERTKSRLIEMTVR